jgi:hypothetical protein
MDPADDSGPMIVVNEGRRAAVVHDNGVEIAGGPRCEIESAEFRVTYLIFEGRDEISYG